VVGDASDGLAVVFDPAIDGGSWPPLAGDDAAFGVAWLGPQGLLDRLELELGVARSHALPIEREIDLARCLIGSSGFWTDSFAKICDGEPPRPTPSSAARAVVPDHRDRCIEVQGRAPVDTRINHGLTMTTGFVSASVGSRGCCGCNVELRHALFRGVRSLLRACRPPANQNAIRASRRSVADRVGRRVVLNNLGAHVEADAVRKAPRGGLVVQVWTSVRNCSGGEWRGALRQ
jgi:hypothetical protein